MLVNIIDINASKGRGYVIVSRKLCDIGLTDFPSLRPTSPAVRCCPDSLLFLPSIVHVFFVCPLFSNPVFSLASIHERKRRRENKKARLSLTNPRDAKACQKLLQFDVLTTLSLTILAYLHAFSCCCVRNLRNPAKFTENSNL